MISRETKGFFSYLVNIPVYIWYTVGEWVVKKLFPKSFEVWFATELKCLNDIETYLDDRDKNLYKQLEEKNSIIDNISNENNELRRIHGMNALLIEADSSASYEGEVRFGVKPEIDVESQLLDLIKVTQQLMLMYMKLKGDKLPVLKKGKKKVKKKNGKTQKGAKK